ALGARGPFRASNQSVSGLSRGFFRTRLGDVADDPRAERSGEACRQPLPEAWPPRERRVLGRRSGRAIAGRAVVPPERLVPRAPAALELVRAGPGVRAAEGEGPHALARGVFYERPVEQRVGPEIPGARPGPPPGHL